MKIGLVCPYNMFVGGGVQECVNAMYIELKQRGHTVKIITPTPRASNGNVHEDMVFIGTGMDVKTPFHTTAQVSVTPKVEVVDQMLEEEAFDVLHFHEPWISTVSRQILARSKAKNVATFHAKLPETMMSRTLEKVATPYMKPILKYLDVLTAVSEPAAAYIKTLTNTPIAIIPNGIDLKTYRNGSKSARIPNTILYVGRLERRKGVKYLIKAFAELKLVNPSARLIIAGDGSDRIKLENYVAEQDISNVSFLGFVSQDEKIKLLHSSSLFCSAAPYGESFGIVLLEAMAAGLPIVAGNNSGYEAVMKDTGQISIVNPKDTTEFARRLQLLISDEALRKLLLSWASEYVKQFDYPHIVDEYESIYKDIVRK